MLTTRTLLCCLALVASAAVPAALVLASAPAEAQHVAYKIVASKQCTLPTTAEHTPRPDMSAKVNADKTITFYGSTCPGALVAVFNWTGNVQRTDPKSLVCDTRPNASGHFSCRSAHPYGKQDLFGVIIAGATEISVNYGTPRHPHPPRHLQSLHPPQTGFGGKAPAVARHKPRAR
jgi:hypothetical protein